MGFVWEDTKLPLLLKEEEWVYSDCSSACSRSQLEPLLLLVLQQLLLFELQQLQQLLLCSLRQTQQFLFFLAAGAAAVSAAAPASFLFV